MKDHIGADWGLCINFGVFFLLEIIFKYWILKKKKNLFPFLLGDFDLKSLQKDEIRSKPTNFLFSGALVQTSTKMYNKVFFNTTFIAILSQHTETTRNEGINLTANVAAH